MRTIVGVVFVCLFASGSKQIKVKQRGCYVVGEKKRPPSEAESNLFDGSIRRPRGEEYGSVTAASVDTSQMTRRGNPPEVRDQRREAFFGVVTTTGTFVPSSQDEKLQNGTKCQSRGSIVAARGSLCMYHSHPQKA